MSSYDDAIAMQVAIHFDHRSRALQIDLPQGSVSHVEYTCLHRAAEEAALNAVFDHTTFRVVLAAMQREFSRIRPGAPMLTLAGQRRSFPISGTL